jgi:hypothetical protein
MAKVYTINGLPVVDAKRALTLHITKADIARAADSIKKPESCAAARACYRELHAKEVRIHTYRAYVRTNESNWVRYWVPTRLRQEIVAFDRGGQFEPGEYKLDKIPPSSAVTGKTQGTRPPRKKQGPPRKSYKLQNVRGGPATMS